MVVIVEFILSCLVFIVFGIGDIDCVYYFVFYEFILVVEILGFSDVVDMFFVMVNGKRLKDIFDFFLDFVV